MPQESICTLHFSMMHSQNLGPHSCRGRMGLKKITLVGALALVVLLTWDIPVGYYNFVHACHMEGGLRTLGPLAAAHTLRMEPPRFSSMYAEGALRRHTSLDWVEAKKQNLAEAPYLRYTRSPANLIVVDANASDDAPDYVIRYEQHLLPMRLLKDTYELRSNRGDVAATWSAFHFAWTDPTRTLLGRTTMSRCFTDPAPYEQLISLVAR